MTRKARLSLSSVSGVMTGSLSHGVFRPGTWGTPPCVNPQVTGQEGKACREDVPIIGSSHPSHLLEVPPSWEVLSKSMQPLGWDGDECGSRTKPDAHHGTSVDLAARHPPPPSTDTFTRTHPWGSLARKHAGGGWRARGGGKERDRHTCTHAGIHAHT